MCPVSNWVLGQPKIIAPRQWIIVAATAMIDLLRVPLRWCSGDGDSPWCCCGFNAAAAWWSLRGGLTTLWWWCMRSAQLHPERDNESDDTTTTKGGARRNNTRMTASSNWCAKGGVGQERAHWGWLCGARRFWCICRVQLCVLAIAYARRMHAMDVSKR